jgi:hypothetical protein
MSSKPSRSALSICTAAALLAGCGGSQGQSGTTREMPQGAAPGRIAHQGSWMRPGTSRTNLLYVGNVYYLVTGTTDVYVFSYPTGDLVGKLTGFQNPKGICADASGNVFITDNRALDVVEYAHGGSDPINTLSDPDSPNACSVDAETGNLAVSNDDSTVSIFAQAMGTPSVLSTPFRPYFAAYDNRGNLFIDGWGDPLPVAKLPKGHRIFKPITLDKRTRNFGPAGLQWYNDRLAAGSADPASYGCCGRIYRFKIVGKMGIKAGSGAVVDSTANFFIQGSTAVIATETKYLDFYSYPRLAYIRRMSQPGYSSYGVAVSLGSERRK